MASALFAYIAEAWNKSTFGGSNQFYTVRQDIRAMLSRNWEANIAFVHREANGVADLMAKYDQSLSFGSSKLFNTPPES
ncbi:putative ribonuclease h protein [Senna tora]|uniref:Putative ribonuclease h protein n=1 Tax=Senna tora TaxID=362788 RepID=A0A834WQU9_9FABA|nr:putative ribonuclease h protein [Senna tora]